MTLKLCLFWAKYQGYICTYWPKLVSFHHIPICNEQDLSSNCVSLGHNTKTIALHFPKLFTLKSISINLTLGDVCHFSICNQPQ